MPATEVRKPVAVIQHEGAARTEIYVLRDKTQKFRMPGVKDESPRAWDYGPSIITQYISPQSCSTHTAHPDDEKVWKWLSALLGIGAYVMQQEVLRDQIPENLKTYWK